MQNHGPVTAGVKRGSDAGRAGKAVRHRLGLLVPALLLLAASWPGDARAELTVTAGGFQVQFWDSADGDHVFGTETIDDGDLGTWTAAERQAIIRAFEHWSERLNVTAGANAPLIRVVKDIATAGHNANASSALNSSATPSQGGAVLQKTNVFSRLMEGTNPARLDGIDGRIVYIPGGETYNLDTFTQFMPGDFALERQSVHEIGHLLGLTGDHEPFTNQLDGTNSFAGTNAVATFGAAVPVDPDDAHFLLQFHTMTRANPFGTSFRNIPYYAPAELAVLRDMGYTGINLADHFGLAIYQDGGDVQQTNAANYTSSTDYAVGVFSQAGNVNLLQTGDITISGFAGAGLRIAGRDTDTGSSIYTIAPTADLIISGESGVGIIASSGANNHIVHRGTIAANGTDGRGIVFDFGPTFNDNQIDSGDYDAYLVTQLDLSGSISAENGTGNILEIASTAAVREINIMQGASFSGHIESNAFTSLTLTRPTLTFGKLADANGVATAAGDAAFVFNWNGDITGSTRMDVEMHGGQANLGGTLNVRDVEILDGTLTSTGFFDSFDVTVQNGGLVLDDGDLLDVAVNGGTFRVNGTVVATSQTQTAGLSDIVGSHGLSGAYDLQDGFLRVNGGLTALGLAIGGPATLGGAGQVTTTNGVTNQGTIAPGNSIGTLAIVGDLTNDATGEFDIEINNLGTVPGVNNDLVTVTGTTTINGGTVNVDAAPGPYLVGSQYDFLESNALTVNTALLFNETTDIVDRRLIGTFDATTYSFLMARDVPFATLGETFNQQAFGAYFDIVNADPALQPVRDILDLIPLEDDVRTAVDQLSGEIYGTLLITQVQNVNLLFDNIATQTRPDVFRGTQCQKGVWYQGYGTGGIADEDRANAHRARLSTHGQLLGVSGCAGDSITFGGLYNYEEQSTRIQGVRSSGMVTSHRVGTYAAHDGETGYETITGVVGVDEYDVTRRIQFAAVDQVANGDTNGWHAGVNVEKGMYMQFGWFMLDPYVAGRYTYVGYDALTETGADVLNLRVEDTNFHSLRSAVGARAQIDLKSRRVVALFDAAWQHEYLDAVPTFDAAFAVAPQPHYTARGLNLGRDWLSVGPTLKFAINDHVGLTGQYRAMVSGRQALHAGTGGLEIVW